MPGSRKAAKLLKEVPGRAGRPGTIVLTKRDVARRELATAIRLFFAEGDPVAIHVLVSAAAAILHAVGTARGVDTTRLLFLDTIRDDKHEVVKAMMDEASNFMKHGSKDPDEILATFTPDANEIQICCSTIDYYHVFGETFFEIGLMTAFMAATRPELFKNDPRVTVNAAALNAFSGEAPVDKAAAARALASFDRLRSEGLIDKGEPPPGGRT